MVKSVPSMGGIAPFMGEVPPSWKIPAGFFRRSPKGFGSQCARPSPWEPIASATGGLLRSLRLWRETANRGAWEMGMICRAERLSPSLRFSISPFHSPVGRFEDQEYPIHTAAARKRAERAMSCRKRGKTKRSHFSQGTRAMPSMAMSTPDVGMRELEKPSPH